MSWVKLDFRDTGASLVNFVIPRSRMLALSEMVVDSPERAALLAGVYEKLIESVRPELAGCQVIAFGYKPEQDGVYIQAFHPSLPRVSMGQSIPFEALFREGGVGDELVFFSRTSDPTKFDPLQK